MCLALLVVPLVNVVLAAVPVEMAGGASGLFSTAQQLGGALGVAVFSTVATNRTSDLIKTGESTAAALTSGFTLAFWVAVSFAVVALVATLLMIHAEEIGEPAAEPSPTG